MTLKLNKTCEGCGYVPPHVCLLALVYIDGCIDGNDPSNYKTLCANCQRDEAAMNDDDVSPEDRDDVREAWRQELIGRNFF